MESIMHKLRFMQSEMGPAEKRIADYILNHTGEMVALSISELAKKCACGDATVVRLSRRLGLEGYQALKIKLAGELSASSMLGEEIRKGDSCYDIFKKQNSNISESLLNTESVLDAEQLERVAELVMHSDRIVLFGLGNSAAIAQDAAGFKLSEYISVSVMLSAKLGHGNHIQLIAVKLEKHVSVTVLIIVRHLEAEDVFLTIYKVILIVPAIFASEFEDVYGVNCASALLVNLNLVILPVLLADAEKEALAKIDKGA